MAYMSQEKKASLAPAIKAILAEYKLHGSLGVHHHSTLVLNIKSGPVDFFKDYRHPADMGETRTHLDVNTYHVDSHFTGKSKEILRKLVDAMMVGNHDRSDIQSDYVDVGWYIDINIGKWNKPYILLGA